MAPRTVAAVSFVSLVAAQIALPLVDGATTGVVSLVVTLLASTTISVAMFGQSTTRVAMASGVIAVVAFGLELLGSRSGFPFGEYDYTDALRPQLLGVPLIVPIAWVAMTIPSLEIGRLLSGNRIIQCLVGGWCLMAWDLLLDPMMVEFGYWQWADQSGWQDIPWTNYVGWFVGGSAMCAIAGVFTNGAENRWLVGVYAWMTGFSALGFLIPIAFDVPVVGVVGGLASLPLAVAALLKGRSWQR